MPLALDDLLAAAQVVHARGFAVHWQSVKSFACSRVQLCHFRYHASLRPSASSNQLIHHSSFPCPRAGTSMAGTAEDQPGTISVSAERMTDQVYWLPCKVSYDGPAKVADYFIVHEGRLSPMQTKSALIGQQMSRLVRFCLQMTSMAAVTCWPPCGAGSCEVRRPGCTCAWSGWPWHAGSLLLHRPCHGRRLISS